MEKVCVSSYGSLECSYAGFRYAGASIARSAAVRPDFLPVFSVMSARDSAAPCVHTTSTYSCSLGLAKKLQERGIHAHTSSPSSSNHTTPSTQKTPPSGTLVGGRKKSPENMMKCVSKLRILHGTLIQTPRFESMEKKNYDN